MLKYDLYKVFQERSRGVGKAILSVVDLLCPAETRQILNRAPNSLSRFPFPASFEVSLYLTLSTSYCFFGHYSVGFFDPL